ncbi:MAG TPA: ABC transporter ATP-binding protein [Anaerolineaceae bacterium]
MPMNSTPNLPATPLPSTQQEGCLICLRNLVKTYVGSEGSFTALRGIDLTVNTGEFVSIVGKSGCGKSTLINMITGIDRPTSGEITVANTAIHRLNEEQVALWRGANVGVIFQFFQLLPTLTAIENVMLPMDYSRKFSISQRPARALAILEQLGMAEHAHKMPTTLSGGQQQSIAIARSLANDPPLIVADEPTGNLDSQSAELVFHLFEQLVDQGKTIVMVTHDRELAEHTRRIVILSDGKVVTEYIPQANGKSVGEHFRKSQNGI